MVGAETGQQNVSHQYPPIRRNLLRLGAAALIPEMLDDQGLSIEAAFGRAGDSGRSFSQPDVVVPLIWIGRIFKSAAAATAQAEFGLLVGLRAGSRITGWGDDPTLR